MTRRHNATVDGQVEFTAEEEAARDAEEASFLVEQAAEKVASIRAERNRLLTESDWVVVRAKELGQNVPKDWYDYRGDLRQLPEQAGFPNVTFPTKPTS